MFVSYPTGTLDDSCDICNVEKWHKLKQRKIACISPAFKIRCNDHTKT